MVVNWSTLQYLSSNNAPASAGVYLLYASISGGNPFYVGQAADLKQRLQAHQSPSETNPCIKRRVQNGNCAYRYATVSRQSDRDGIEKYLYDYYKKPECNDRDPGGTPIPVNLP
jgi:excinuclease UvrABC nuclease subunit